MKELRHIWMMNAFKSHFYSVPEFKKAVYSGRGTVITYYNTLSKSKYMFEGNGKYPYII